MHSLAEAFLILWLLAALGLLAYLRRHLSREKKMMEALRQGQMYGRLYQKMLYLCQNYDIDQLRVEQHGVTVTSVSPAHTLLNFDFKQNGKGKRCDIVPRLTAQLLQEDFPQLLNRGIYKATRYRVYRSNGKREYGYGFTMRRRHKDLLIYRKSTVELRIM